MRNVAVIFAGGVGSRMGKDIPKQFLEWNGKAIIIHTLTVFENCDKIDAVVLACKEDWIPYTKELIEKAELKKVVSIVPGGNTALESQYNGLKEVKRIYPEERVCVLIHDGVRPLVTAETIERCIEGVEQNGNAITVTRAIETVIMIDDNEEIADILNRDYCRMAKAPQCFLLDDILAAHEDSISSGVYNYIDSASMMIAHGHKLHTVFGEPENIKITTPSDYYMFLGISQEREKEE